MSGYSEPAAAPPAPQSQTPPPAAPLPAEAPEEPAYIAELESLAELRDQGVITAEEFEAKKRELLGL